MELVVKLVSPLCAGSGVGRAGVVDREAVFDPDTGLPQIPGRRLKGLLRDSYSQILRSGGLAAGNLPQAEQVFGEPGAKEGGWLRIGDANLDPELYPDVKNVVSADKSPMRQVDVLTHYSEVRRQTAIDRETGVADEDTLRFSRVLRTGLEFRAPLYGLDKEEARHAVALAASGVKRMGTARSRGWGEVRVCVQEAGKDLSRAALDLLRGGAKLPSTDTAFSLIPGPRPAANSDSTLTHRLCYQIVLKSAAVLSAAQQADPNTVSSAECIAGSTVRGLLAHRYIAAHGVDSCFHHLFSSGQVVILPANPMWGEHSTLAIPSSVRTNKRNPKEAPIDLAASRPHDNYQPKRETGWTVMESLLQGHQSPRISVAKNLHYHHQRAHDARVQRALGGEPEDIQPYTGMRMGQQGALFVYESLLPGQSFSGEILGSCEDLQTLLGLLNYGSTVQVGRSKSAQYGGEAKWHWLSSVEEFHPIAEAKEAAESGCDWFIWLLTPMIACNQYGHPAAEFPYWEIDPNASIKSAFTRRELQSGYLSHQNLPRQQMPALAAGSMFVVKVPAGLHPESVARRSYGLRIEEGFGRIAIARLSLTSSEFKKEKKGGPPLPTLSPASPARGLAIEILKEQVREQTKAKARVIAADVLNIEAIHRHQLHRLVLLLESGASLDDFARLILKARKTAARQFERVRVPVGGGRNRTLSEYLVGMAQSTGTALTFVLANWGIPNWTTVLGLPADSALKADTAFQQDVCRAFLLSFLSALARREKK